MTMSTIDAFTVFSRGAAPEMHDHISHELRVPVGTQRVSDKRTFHASSGEQMLVVMMIEQINRGWPRILFLGV
jgi:hypothetical protein